MAQHVEPMDIDTSVCDFDNKENSLHHNNVLSKSPCTEKGYEELDVTELTMKLRYSVTPSSSPMSKSYTANYHENRNLEGDSSALDNHNLTRSLNMNIMKNDKLPLQTITVDECLDSNRNPLRTLDTTTPENNVTITGPSGIDENLSLPSSSSSAVHTPEATTPTNDIKGDGGSPILRGLKSVLNMFRPSQSPIPTEYGVEGIKPEAISPPVINSPETADSRPQDILASTPLAAQKTKRSNMKPRESLVFNEDLEKDLEWKDDGTIIFSNEKIPIHKLLLQHTGNSIKIENNVSNQINSSVEYMDISYNDSVVLDKTVTQNQSFLSINKDVNVAVESDGEFVDCESTFTKDDTDKGKLDTSQQIMPKNVEPTDVLNLNVTPVIGDVTESINSSNKSVLCTATVTDCDVAGVVSTTINPEETMLLPECEEAALQLETVEENVSGKCNVTPVNIDNVILPKSTINNVCDRRTNTVDKITKVTEVVDDNAFVEIVSDFDKPNASINNPLDNKDKLDPVPSPDLGVSTLSMIPLIVDPRVLLFNVEAPISTSETNSQNELDMTPADVPLPDDDEVDKNSLVVAANVQENLLLVEQDKINVEAVSSVLSVNTDLVVPSNINMCVDAVNYLTNENNLATTVTNKYSETEVDLANIKDEPSMAVVPNVANVSCIHEIDINTHGMTKADVIPFNDETEVLLKQQDGPDKQNEIRHKIGQSLSSSSSDKALEIPLMPESDAKHAEEPVTPVEIVASKQNNKGNTDNVSKTFSDPKLEVETSIHQNHASPLISEKPSIIEPQAAVRFENILTDKIESDNILSVLQENNCENKALEDMNKNQNSGDCIEKPHMPINDINVTLLVSNEINENSILHVTSQDNGEGCEVTKLNTNTLDITVNDKDFNIIRDMPNVDIVSEIIPTDDVPDLEVKPMFSVENSSNIYCNSLEEIKTPIEMSTRNDDNQMEMTSEINEDIITNEINSLEEASKRDEVDDNTKYNKIVVDCTTENDEGKDKTIVALEQLPVLHNVEDKSLDEEIIASENNSPFVSVTVDEKTEESFELVSEVKSDEKNAEGDFTPSSPKIISKGAYHFNFDEMEDPFATKTKIRASPPPGDGSPNGIIDEMRPNETSEHVLEKAPISQSNVLKNRRRSHPIKRKPISVNKKMNSTFGTFCTEQDNKNLNTKPEIDVMNIPKLLAYENNANNTPTTDIVTQEEKMDFEDTSAPLIEERSSEIGINEKSESSRESLSTLNNEIRTTSSSEQSAYYSAASSEGIDVTKSVFNLPEIDDMNFNPFVTKSKMRQSPPPGLETDISFDMKRIDDKENEPLKSTGVDNVLSSLPDVNKNDTFEKLSNEDLPVNNTTNSSKSIDDTDVTVRTVPTEDEDTIEGPFLEPENLIEVKVTDYDNVNQEQFCELPVEANDDNSDGGEMFIDAQAYEFLLNQNNPNIVADSGKESLFLKFDPLFAKRMSTDGVMAALNKFQKKQSTPKKMANPANVTFVAPSPVAPVAGPSAMNVTQDVDISDVSSDDLNITVSKPMMVVSPAVNAVTPRNKTTTPVRSNRQSLTFTSPAIAVIDRLLSLSANNSLLDQNTTVTEPNRENHEADLALTQLRELLTDKEISVHNLRTESKELKERLLALETQVQTLESTGEEKLKKINELTERLDEKTKINKGMATVVEEYERTIASLISETEQDKKRHAEERLQLMTERDEQANHLASMEISFNDLHSKYEKCKQVILGFKANEDTFKKSMKDFDENFNKMQKNYEFLKQHATSKLNHANEELQKLNRSHESEVLKLNAMIKRKELHITSLEETLSQKMKANEELTKICDELLNKV